MSALPRVGVGLCGDLEEAAGLDLAAVADALEESSFNVRVEVLPGLCHSPDHVASLASRTEVSKVVLGLCGRPTRSDEFQAAARRAGLDPFAVELVDLEGVEDTDTAAPVLAAATARLSVFAGSKPEELKLRLVSFEQPRTRRSLFTMPPITYVPVASIEEERCLGPRSCGLCVEACPVSAIGPMGGRLSVVRERCASCGVCVTRCPTSATSLPGSTLAQYESELAILLSAKAPSLLFTCEHTAGAHAAGDGLTPLSAGWLPVTVPCLEMVTPGWILQALARGAPAVALRGCGEDCISREGATVGSRVDFVRELLPLLGDEAASGRVSLLPADSELPQADKSAPSTIDAELGVIDGALSLLDPAATTQAVTALAESCEAGPDLTLNHSGSPLGVLTLREVTCTACGACPGVCPTGALLSEQGGPGETVISFDARLCVGCGNCVGVCPEQSLGTLSVEPGIGVLALARGRVVLKRAGFASCGRCGLPIAPDAMLNRIRTLLDADDASEPLIATLTELCSDCRALESTPSASG